MDREDLERIDTEIPGLILNTCEQRIIPLADHLIGRVRDVDGDGRFTVLLTGKIAGVDGAETTVEGFVRGADYDPQLMAPFGNRSDLLYLDSRHHAGPHLRTILAHEYTHAVLAGRKGFSPDGQREGDGEDAWLDEAIAHQFETLHGFASTNLAHRVEAFFRAPERYSLVVADYYASGLLRSHGHRGAAYLFLSWCVERFGTTYLTRVAESPSCGIPAVEQATGCSFRTLMRQWSLAMALDPRGPRPYLLRPDGPIHDWESVGTSYHAVLVEPASTGAIEVEIAAPERVEWQVTFQARNSGSR